MNLTPEQQALGRRNFLKVVAGVPALAGLGTAAAMKGPLHGGPVRVGFIGVGGEGRVLLAQVDPAFAEVRAMADINPTQLQRADEVLAKNKQPPARHYEEWRDMLQKEDLEAVIIAVPLWAHADVTVGCLEAGKHVLCEKMMAWDEVGCERMLQAAAKSGRLLEIGYQRNYNPMYEAALDGVVRAGTLGDIYFARLVWHRNGNWRRQGQPPTPDFDPSPWGYPSFEHLLNWRLYWKYSKGLFAELASHQVNICNQVFGSEPESVSAAGGVHRFKDGREAYDHVYATFEYPNGRTAVFSSIESNSFDDYYEMYAGTKGTLILTREREAMLFEEGSEGQATAIETSARGAGPVIDASETKPASRGGAAQATAAPGTIERGISTERQIQRFCSAIRVGTPLATGPDKALASARACIRAHEAVEARTWLRV